MGGKAHGAGAEGEEVGRRCSIPRHIRGAFAWFFESGPAPPVRLCGKPPASPVDRPALAGDVPARDISTRHIDPSQPGGGRLMPARPDAHETLPSIPLIELGDDPMVELARRELPRTLALVATIGRQFGPAMALLDPPSRRWLARSGSPYRQEIDRIAALVGRPGAHALNLSFEWACSSAAAPDPLSEGERLWRTLDWPFNGVGRHVVAARQAGAAGPWINLTWPGFVGALTLLAPGRFAAAINQPPLRRRTGIMPLDWLLVRRDVGRSRALPPSHLLRQVAEEAPDYAAARRLLSETPVCTPAIFILTGIRPGEGCIIERLEQRAIAHEAPAAATNHWLTPALGPGDRGIDDAGRFRAMTALLAGGGAGAPLAWVRPPVLNRWTRLAVEANALTGRLVVRGYEADGPATETFVRGMA
jgi:hypothetical protein